MSLRSNPIESGIYLNNLKMRAATKKIFSNGIFGEDVDGLALGIVEVGIVPGGIDVWLLLELV